MKKTKRSSILHALCLTVLVCFMFSSCSVEDLAENPDTRLTVDKSTITAIITGTDRSGNKPTINIVANRGFELSCDADWIKPQITSGKGVVSVPIDIDGNDSGSTRVGKLTVKSKEKSEIVTITQNLDPDTDDKLEIGHVYLNEDFAWVEQYGGQDQVQFPDQGTTISVRKQATAVSRFLEYGYGEYNYTGDCMYMAKHYLKLGRTAQQNGLTIKLQNITPGKSTNIKLTFDAAPVIDYTNGAITNIDPTTITVEIIDGDGTVNNATSRLSDAMSMNIQTYNQWANMEVILYGVTANTQIVIRSTQQKETGKKRWYLDNVKMVKTTR